MPHFCCVVKCSNRSERDRVSFFRLPAILKRGGSEKIQLSIERRNKWLVAINRADIVTEKKRKWLRVCGAHFITGKPCAIEDIHNPDWVPSLKLGYVRKSPTNYKLISKGTNRKRVVNCTEKKREINLSSCSRLIGHVNEEEDIQVSSWSRVVDYNKEKEDVQSSPSSRLVDHTKETEGVQISSCSELVNFIKEIVPPLPLCYRLVDYNKEKEDAQMSSGYSLVGHTKELVEMPSSPASSDSFLTNSDIDAGRQSNLQTAKIFMDGSQMTNLTASDILKLEKENKLLMVLKKRCSEMTDKEVLYYTGLPDKKLLNLWLSEDL